MSAWVDFRHIKNFLTAPHFNWQSLTHFNYTNTWLVNITFSPSTSSPTSFFQLLASCELTLHKRTMQCTLCIRNSNENQATEFVIIIQRMKITVKMLLSRTLELMSAADILNEYKYKFPQCRKTSFLSLRWAGQRGRQDQKTSGINKLLYYIGCSYIL